MIDRVIDKLLWRVHGQVLSRPSGKGAGQPLMVAGLFRAASGIGASASLCADGLEAAGEKIHRIDLSQSFQQVDIEAAAPLHAKPLPGGTIILHMNAPEFARAAFLLRNWRGSGRRVIGMWAWELPVAPLSWSPATRWLSEIWAPSAFTAQALMPLSSKPVKVVPHWVRSPPKAEGPSTLLPAFSGLTCLTFADGKSSFERKNVLGAIRAFRAADFSGPARLVLKMRGLAEREGFYRRVVGAINDDQRITILDASLSTAQVGELIAAADVVLSLHRSEGFGLTLAEAMVRGKAVVATGWSGNTDFMNADCAMVVGYRLIPARDEFGVYAELPDAQWAEPDEAAAARALERLEGDTAFRLQLGKAAALRVASLGTGRQYVEALRGPAG